MEYIKDITIMEAVVHVLDNNGEEPILNEYQLDLNDDVYTFLFKHLDKCLKDEDLKYAIFKEDKSIVRKISQEYLSLERDVLSASKDLAKQFFRLMKQNGNIESGDFFTIGFTTEYGPMVAILKMDYVKNFTHEVGFFKEKLGINIVTQSAGLPGSSQKIYKAAFIKVLKKENEFDLMVIDKKFKSKNEEYGSNYFTENFLECTIVANERDMTKSFLRAAETWTRNHIREDAAKAEKIRTTIKTKLKEEDVIDVENLSNELFDESPDRKESFKEFIQAQGIDKEIIVDKEWIENKLKRVRLKIDKDIDLYITEEGYHDNSRFEIQRNCDGSINILIKSVMNYIEK